MRISSILILLQLLSNLAYAGPVAIVTSLKGNAFLANDSTTVVLSKGDHIKSGNEILVEGNSQVTISDYYDHRYHLAGATHIKLVGRDIELRSGYLWYQSTVNSGKFSIRTSNSQVDYHQGEAIVSFDSYSGKTQLLVISGTSNFSNLMDKTLSTEVQEGKFSFINGKKDGVPRVPTTVGAKSYKKLTSNFLKVRALDKIMDGRLQTRRLAKRKVMPTRQRKRVRKIASIEIPGAKTNAFESAFRAQKNAKVGTKMKIIETNKQSKAEKIIRDISSLGKPDLSKVEIKIYGHGYDTVWKTRTPSSLNQTNIHGKKRSNKKLSRAPSSVMNESTKPGKILIRKLKSVAKKGRAPAAIVPAHIPKPEPKMKVFDKGLKKEYKKQMKHDDDFNNLIKSLKSIKMDYDYTH